MKYLGIDYGSKKVGLALSDEDGMMAFPFKTILNNNEFIDALHNICGEEDIQEIIIGESKNSLGEPNKIMEKINDFKDQLALEIGLPIHFEKEFMTSLHSDTLKTKDIFSARQNKKEIKNKNDSQAAALILQRFLDRNNQK